MKEPRMTQVFFDTVWPAGVNGYYVEIGAWDGRRKNSTIILEKAGWTGTAIEPSPESFRQLTKNRKCRCLNVAVFDHDGEVDFVIFPDRPEWNGILQTFDDAHRKKMQDPNIGRPAEITKISCKSWNSLDLPSDIDYMQLDVEGAELAILDCIDWTKQRISYICLEDNHFTYNSQYRDYMTNLGYELITNSYKDYLYKKL